MARGIGPRLGPRHPTNRTSMTWDFLRRLQELHETTRL